MIWKIGPTFASQVRVARKQSELQSIVVDVTASNWLDVSRHRWYKQNYSIHRGIDLRGRIHGSLKTTVV